MSLVVNVSTSASGLIGNSLEKSILFFNDSNISLSIASTGISSGLVTNVSNNLTLTLSDVIL